MAHTKKMALEYRFRITTWMTFYISFRSIVALHY